MSTTIHKTATRENSPTRGVASTIAATVTRIECGATAIDSPNITDTQHDDSLIENVNPAYTRFKRAMDIALSVIFIIVGAPLFAASVIIVRMSGRGPVIFRQRRLGLRGEEFWCYKFRTMVPDAEDQLRKHQELWQRFEQSFKLKNDPRVTRAGRFLRKTSLDEMPQLFNVLRGEMSIIGPRPIVPSELLKYGPYGEKLLSVKPGLSGMWQAYGRSDTTYNKRVELDMIYVDNRSAMLDLRLLLLTFKAVFARKGAC